MEDMLYYAKYNCESSNIISLKIHLFTSCQAVYGWVICVISSNVETFKAISSSTFQLYIATISDYTSHLGGSAVYMQIIRGSLTKFKFLNNESGWSFVKMINTFDSPNQVFMLSEKQDFVSVSDCHLEVSKESKSCIFPINCKNTHKLKSMKSFLIIDLNESDFNESDYGNKISKHWMFILIGSAIFVLQISVVITTIVYQEERKFKYSRWKWNWNDIPC